MLFRTLRARLAAFLEFYGDRPLVDADFARLINGKSGAERFSRLLVETGHADDPGGFLRELVERLTRVRSGDELPLRMGRLVLPYHLLFAALEVIVPGGGTRNIKTLDELEESLNINVSEQERGQLERVLEMFPVRFSMHSIRQMRLSPGVTRQYAPFVGELDQEGDTHTWVGQYQSGMVEQMYRNRVIFVMNMSCPVYCRFCFRKHKECRNQPAPTISLVKQAVDKVRAAAEVSEILLTGGDPFLNQATLRFAVEELSKVPHVRTLRLATRSLSYYPELFLRDEEALIRYLKRINLELLERGKRVEVATHFVHPHEISVDGLYVISTLARSGVPVYVQLPYIKDCNDSWPELLELFSTLRGAGAELYYIFMPTSPIRGNRSYWASIDSGLEVYRELRMRLSDRAMPNLTTATSIGKLDWNSSGWAVERDAEDPEYLWLRTPYDPDYYQPFASISENGQRTRLNPEGTYEVGFRAQIGDEALFLGQRHLPKTTKAGQSIRARPSGELSSWLVQLSDQQQQPVIADLDSRTGSALTRSHWCRAELELSREWAQIEVALSYVRERSEITELVLWGRRGLLEDRSKTLEVIDRLAELGHVAAVRLRAPEFTTDPAVFSRPFIASLASRNHLRVTRPRRLEVELEILHATQLGPEQARLVRELRLVGITVYNDSPLLSFINDSAREALAISHACRELGIEFNNLVLAGAPVQREWNQRHPIELERVIEIATLTRRHGSGREVPRYLLRTELGEVDLSLAPPLFSYDEAAQLLVTLRPHRLEFYRAIDPAFEWPAFVRLDGHGHPTLPVGGLVSSSEDRFFVRR